MAPDSPAQMSPLHVPTEEDWRSEEWGIDTPRAYRHFFGKSLSDAFELFVEDALYYQEDVMFMPLRCFQFYVHAYIDYLLSDKSKGDSDGASCFFGLVEVRCEDFKTSGEVLLGRVRQVLMDLRGRQDWYAAHRHIYGDFSQRADAALVLIQAPASEV